MTRKAASAQDDLDLLLYRLFETAKGREDPYPIYEALRAYGQPFKSGLGVTVLSTFRDCRYALTNARFGHADNHSIDRSESMHSALGAVMLETNPPVHTRLRAVVSAAFAPRHSHTRYAPLVDSVVADVFDELPDLDCDVVASIALRVPPRVICGILGLEPSAATFLIPHVRTSIGAIDRAVVQKDDEDKVLSSVRVIQEYFREQIADRRRVPRNDLLTHLVNACDVNKQLSQSELLSMILLLFVAGYESTANLISSMYGVLVSTSWLWPELTDEIVDVPSTIQEVLRWETPVQFVGRTALESTMIGDAQIRAGEQVLILLGSANRDESAFHNASEFRPKRSGPQPLSFSAGIHYCLGAPLARLEAETVLRETLRRYKGVEAAMDQETRYRSNAVLRGIDELWVTFQ